MSTIENYDSRYPGQKRADAPLPPLPSSASSHTNYHHNRTFSPDISSSYDSSYRPAGRRSDQSLGVVNDYYVPSGENPFRDPNHYSDDIPLQHHPTNGDSAPSSPQDVRHDSSGVNNLESREHRRDRTRQKKRSLFTKKIPWAVYFFTAIQIAVFLAELVKNGNYVFKSSQ